MFAFAPLGCGPANPSAPDAASILCSAPGGALTHSGTLASSQTWDADSSHVVTADLTVPAGVSLTLAPCAQVRLKQKVNIIVKGTLRGRGEAARPISFSRDDPARRFSAIWITAPGSAELAHVSIDGGGADAGLAYGASVVVEGSGFPPDKPLLVDHVTISNSAGYGIWLRRWAGFADGSRELTVTGAGQDLPTYPFPVQMSLNTVGTLPAGHYTGNADDEVQLFAEAPHYDVEIDDTIRNRGVPYQVGGAIGFGLVTVRGAGPPTLTIEPGVTLKFYSTASNVGGMFVGWTGGSGPLGRLVAVGTAAAPIIFTGTGKAPAAGSWEGITFYGDLATGNRLERVQIDAAGGYSGDSGYGCPPSSSGGTVGALKIYSQPASSFLHNSTISNSSSHGVFRAWKGTEVDFVQSNTFRNVAGCNQVLPLPPNGRCPTTPPCPK